jgi:hypothetical protein
MSIAVVRATRLCMRGSRVRTSQMINRCPSGKTRQGSVYSTTRQLVHADSILVVPYLCCQTLSITKFRVRL